MDIEFTGERVVPGQVEADLWNEHIARYAFAAELCHERIVLDIGCGTGYGTARLGGTAASTVGVDVAPDAIEYAKRRFAQPNTRWLTASGTQLPFRSGCFDIVVAFELIEHLDDWRSLLDETRRVLRPDGQLIVSTPNKDYYAEARELSGPNPYHRHEFAIAEFEAALTEIFPQVAIFVENHTEGVLIHSITEDPGNAPSRVHVENGRPDPHSANFFVAVCGAVLNPPLRTFMYAPSAANLLRERSLHIENLEREVAEALQNHATMVERFRAQKADLERSNAWAQTLDAELKKAGDEIASLRHELELMSTGYKAKVAELELENSTRLDWVRGLEHQLEERTAWAMRLDRERASLEARLARLEGSRWLRLGRVIGFGPEPAKPTEVGSL